MRRPGCKQGQKVVFDNLSPSWKETLLVSAMIFWRVSTATRVKAFFRKQIICAQIANVDVCWDISMLFICPELPMQHEELVGAELQRFQKVLLHPLVVFSS
jgi:hypothetical protein